MNGPIRTVKDSIWLGMEVVGIKEDGDDKHAILNYDDDHYGFTVQISSLQGEHDVFDRLIHEGERVMLCVEWVADTGPQWVTDAIKQKVE
jgi:hypothetical protein